MRCAKVSQWAEMSEKFVNAKFLRRNPVFTLHFVWYMIQLLFKIINCSFQVIVPLNDH